MGFPACGGLCSAIHSSHNDSGLRLAQTSPAPAFANNNSGTQANAFFQLPVRRFLCHMRWLGQRCKAVHLTPLETVVWSAGAGSIGLIVLLALADTVYSRSRGALDTFAYLSACWLFVFILCGLAAAVFPSLQGYQLRMAQVLVGPLCAGIGSYSASVWLSAHKRDRVTQYGLRASTALCLAGGPLCLLLAGDMQLQFSAGLTLSSLCISIWLSVRAAQSGDRQAWGLACGCLLALPLEIGLYRLALENARPGLAWQGATVFCGTASLALTGSLLWLRNRHERQIKDDGQTRLDPITQLYSSVVMVQKIIHAQQRRARTRRDGAVMAVLVFDPERLLAQVGHYGMNEIYTQLARRMQRHTGVVNPAGRYYDRCFIVLIETMHSPKWIRTLGLRVASSLRKPLEVTSLAGERINITVDIGVGITHLSRVRKDVDQLLHESQDLAQAARGMASRAAVMHPDTHQPVPVESADLGDSWSAFRAQVPERHRKSTHSTLLNAGRRRNKLA
jgi:GGDEF domain-containing protein